MGWTYKDAGVDIDAGDRLVQRIRPLAAAATRPEVMGGIGGFAGLCGIPGRYRDPVLVSGTDGVGTKLKTAFATGRHDTVGVDLVAMSVNDVAVTGAEPLFFLDYFATARLDVDVAEEVVRGIASACREAGCALLGGETAELPGLYAESEYDLAGFCVGVVERGDLRDGRDIEVGDALLGLPSSGLHSNGHSLARKVLLEGLGLAYADRPAQLHGTSVADELLRPTRLYARPLAALGEAGVRFKGAAHVTGGGLIENPPRMLRRDDLAIELDPRTWEVPAVFSLIASAGVAEEEMRRTFNLGLGMVVAVAPADADRAIAALAAASQPAAVVGAVRRRAPGAAQVTFV
ncbi:MAG TPA: phosphoribosylformylglycinamidine cyclo-ligase [Kofleriaceae bacterium]|nr:phosphoribosylformylglycinamidine cyclo-ligase [Kofleriaceae bacterium]